MNTGAEAVETAIKAARRWGYERKGIARRSRGDHRLRGQLSRADDDARRAPRPSRSTASGFGPFTPGFVPIPYGDVAALDAAITPRTCAFLVEPIQCEAGHHPAARRLPARRRCALRASSRCSSSPTRSRRASAAPAAGSPAARERDARSLHSRQGAVGRLLPRLGGRRSPRRDGCVRRPAATAAPTAATRSGAPWRAPRCASSPTSAWSSDPRASARCCSTRSRPLGGGPVCDVRGRGLLVGIELDRPARPFCEQLMARGILCKDTHDRVIRLAPPLVIDEAGPAMAGRGAPRRVRQRAGGVTAGPRHILVTGGAGFIGSALVWALNQRGHERILVADILDRSREMAQPGAAPVRRLPRGRHAARRARPRGARPRPHHASPGRLLVDDRDRRAPT